METLKHRTSIPSKTTKPARRIFWRHANFKEMILHVFVQVRYADIYSTIRSFILCYKIPYNGDLTRVRCVGHFEGKRQFNEAYKILNIIERNCPSIFNKLDAEFWHWFRFTVWNNPKTYRFINTQIRRLHHKCQGS